MRFKDIDEQLTPIPLYIYILILRSLLFSLTFNSSNRIGDVMDCTLTWSVVNRDFEPRSCQTKVYELVFAASPLSSKHRSVRATIGWLGIMIICQSEVTYLHADCRVSELAQYILNQACKAVLV